MIIKEMYKLIFYFYVLLLMINISIQAFELENVNPLKLAKIMMLPQTNYYKEYRIPIVFTDRNERIKEFADEERRKKQNPPPVIVNMKSSEEFHKQKCKIKEFHYIREIAYTYNPETIISYPLSIKIHLIEC